MSNDASSVIIIPCFNESSSIVETIERIRNLDSDYEILVVDDGSTDDSYERAKTTGVEVLRHEENRGYGAALKTGIRHTRHDNLVIIDADGTYLAEEIPGLMTLYLQKKLDMAVGARTKADASIPLCRRPAKWLITRLACFLVGREIADLNSGLRVMRKRTVEKYMRLLPDGFSFTSTITLAMLANGLAVGYMPIDYLDRKGKSKIRPVRDTLNFIQLIVRMVMYFNPLRVFLPLSLLLILGGSALIAIQGILYRNLGTVSVIVLLGGIQLLAIGLMADLIDKRMG